MPTARRARAQRFEAAESHRGEVTLDDHLNRLLHSRTKLAKHVAALDIVLRSLLVALRFLLADDGADVGRRSTCPIHLYRSRLGW